MTFRADLHCHSLCSDGSNTPEELVDLAVKIGLQGLSITDHDTIAAYTTTLPYAKIRGLALGTGVELSCVHNNTSVHVLGYGYPPDSEKLQDFCQRHQKRRKERNSAILKKLERMSMPIYEEELPKIGTIGRPHIAALMVQKGYVESTQEAFQKYIGEGKCCYEQGTSISVEETITLLHTVGAKAFIAHPTLFAKAAFAKKLLELPFDGLECYYAKCAPQEEERWLRIAKDRGLLITGGSDFHGDFKQHLTLGCRWVDEETFRKIFPNA